MRETCLYFFTISNFVTDIIGRYFSVFRSIYLEILSNKNTVLNRFNILKLLVICGNVVLLWTFQQFESACLSMDVEKKIIKMIHHHWILYL